MSALSSRTRPATVAVGARFRRIAVITAAFAIMLSGCQLPSDTPPDSPPAPVENSSRGTKPDLVPTSQVLEAVQAAQGLQEVPESVATTLTDNDQALPQEHFECGAVNNPANANFFGECAYGDPLGNKLMVVYGDSRADMWASTLEAVAKASGWKLRVFAKPACPGPDLPFMSVQTKTPDADCDVFHSTAPEAVKALKPNLVLVTSMKYWLLADGAEPTSQQWQVGWVSTLKKLAAPGTGLVFLGDIAQWNDNGPRCLAAHLKSVQDCSAPIIDAQWGFGDAEQAAAAAAGALFIPTMPWFCAQRCEPIIADKRVFNDDSHITRTYSLYLTGALKEALQPKLT
jgi:hypothetical protein